MIESMHFDVIHNHLNININGNGNASPLDGNIDRGATLSIESNGNDDFGLLPSEFQPYLFDTSICSSINSSSSMSMSMRISRKTALGSGVILTDNVDEFLEEDDDDDDDDGKNDVENNNSNNKLQKVELQEEDKDRFQLEFYLTQLDPRSKTWADIHRGLPVGSSGNHRLLRAGRPDLKSIFAKAALSMAVGVAVGVNGCV